MSCKIQLMSDQLINQIAAGEVVENPSSVVKELVENAIDAEATEIVVEIKQGGRHLIKVFDNGIGMNREECRMAIQRHATSKMRSFSDFDALLTMGFRGEALPSIASVSRFSLLSCPRGEPTSSATLLTIQGEGEPLIHPAHRDGGTTIEVKELFFNVPVRRKFQRSPAHDATDILQILQDLALANLEVGFTLIRDGETLFRLPPEKGDEDVGLKRRIEALLGESFVERLRPVRRGNLWGFIGEPTETRPNRLGQHLFINRRAVVSPLLAEAVREGYGTTIAPMRFPLFVLHLTVNPTGLDVNVHPQKKEVRFEAGEMLAREVQAAVHESLRRVERPHIEPEKRYQVTPVFESLARPFTPLIREERVEVESPKQLLIEPPKVELIAVVKGYLIVRDPEERLLFVHQRRLHERLLYEELMKGERLIAKELYLLPEVITLTPVESERFERALPLLKEFGFDWRRQGRVSFALEAAPLRFENMDLATMMRTIVEMIERSGREALQEEIKSRIVKQLAKAGAVSMERRLSHHEAHLLVEQFWGASYPATSLAGEPLFREIERF